jgi:hypothetical protein
MVTLLIGNTIMDRSPCQVAYFPSSKTAVLINDDGTALAQGSVTPGVGSASNSRCSIVGSQMTASESGSNSVLTLPMTFNAQTFGGSKKVYANTFDNAGNLSHWVQTGTWSVQ